MRHLWTAYSGETKESASRDSTAPPPEFVDAVKDAVTNLYDFAKLNHHPLLRWGLVDRVPPGTSRGNVLRDLLVEAIARMRPGPTVPSTARQRRAFQVLELRYVEAMPFREVMEALVLSQTQYHREQRHAIEMLAAYLWDTLPSGSPVPSEHVTEPNVVGGENAELSRIASAAHLDDEVGVAPFLREIVELMEPLSRRRNVRLRLAPTDEHLVVVTNRTALRNAVISALGWLLEQAVGAEIVLAVEQRATIAHIDMCLRTVDQGGQHGEGSTEKLHLGRHLMHSLGGDLRVSRREEREPSVTLGFPVRPAVLLVIDDNPDLLQMIARYLADQQYLVLTAESVAEGVGLAQRSSPDVILLDVMMPHQDGWDALQILRHHPATDEVPIIVCTVLGEQQLAESLGAAAFLRKPLTRSALLDALQRCLFHRSRLGADNPGAPVYPEASQ